jgi:hypothetical protein
VVNYGKEIFLPERWHFFMQALVMEELAILDPLAGCPFQLNGVRYESLMAFLYSVLCAPTDVRMGDLQNMYLPDRVARAVKDNFSMAECAHWDGREIKIFHTRSDIAECSVFTTEYLSLVRKAAQALVNTDSVYRLFCREQLPIIMSKITQPRANDCLYEAFLPRRLWVGIVNEAVQEVYFQFS